MERSWFDRRPLARMLLAVVSPVVATGVSLAVGSERTTAAALIYLLGVLGASAAGGYREGVVASVLSFVGLNVFFTPPRGTLRVGKTDDLVALVVFLSVGLAVSTLVARSLVLRARAERREYEARSLYAISSRAAGGDRDGAFRELVDIMRSLFGLARCEVRGADGEVIAVSGDGEEPGIEIPLSVLDRPVGVLVLVEGAHRLGEPERRVASIFARQMGSVLEREALEEHARSARVAEEADRVRRALMSAVSHDFRTPLASIKTSITALIPDASGDRLELLRTASEETERLERLVSNLLDLTRIRSGALAPDREAMRVEDLLDDTLAAARRPLGDRRVALLIRPDVPRVFVDPVQIGQALRNVLENAARYSKPGAEIKITAARWQRWVEIRVADRGPGIPEGEREAVFEEFYRLGDARTAGTGLGLAIARAITAANGGNVWVEDTPGGGATLAFRLPAEVTA